MKKFMVQLTLYGFAQIEAETWEEAEDLAEDLEENDFDIQKGNCDIEVIDEIDAGDYDNGNE